MTWTATPITPTAQITPISPATHGGHESGRGAVALVGVVVLASAALLVGTGNPVLAAVPAIVVALLALLVVLPLRVPLLALLGVVALVDILPLGLPGSADGRWHSPVYPLYLLLYENLNKVFPVDALRFSGTEAIYIAMILLAAARTFFGGRALGAHLDRVGRRAGSNALYVALAGALAGAIWLEVYGIAVKHGDFRQSLWQFREILWLPVVTALFSYCLRDRRDLATAGWLLVAAACVKIFIGLYYLIAVALPAGLLPETMTSHNDSVVFVTAIMVVVIRWVHAPSWRRFGVMALVGSWVMFGLVLNNRRIAFVSLGMNLLMVLVLLRGPLKRRALRLVVYSLPLLFAYLIAGRNHRTGVFAPAGLVMSVLQQKDASSATRDIENTNLLFTLRQGKLLGSGWGHEYIELVKAYDISQYFAQYRFVAHNSILWLWTIGGLVGFTLLWMPIGVGVFLARRAYAFSRTPEERMAAVLVLTIFVTYMVQSWGDMGTQGLSCMLIVAIALASGAKLAVATGAVPPRMRFFGVGRPAVPTVTAVTAVAS